MRFLSIMIVLSAVLFAIGAAASAAETDAASDKPLVVFLVNEEPDNYEAHRTIPEFAKELHEKHGFRCKVLQGEGDFGAFRFPEFDVLKQADLVVVFFRRCALPKEQMALIREHLKAGKPLVGIRTANHAFSTKVKVAEGHEMWWEFVPEVLGCENRGYGKEKLGVDAAVVAEVADHEILKGVDPQKWHSEGSLYLVKPLVDKKATVLLTGSAGGKTEPIAWTRMCDKSRVFYTSLGYPSDFDLPQCRRLLTNGIRWALNDKSEQTSK